MKQLPILHRSSRRICHTILHNESGLEIVEWTGLGSILLAIVAMIYMTLVGSGQLRATIRATAIFYAERFGRDIAVNGPDIGFTDYTVSAYQTDGAVEQQTHLQRTIDTIFRPVASAPIQTIDTSFNPQLSQPTTNQAVANLASTNKPAAWAASQNLPIAFVPTTLRAVAYEPVAFNPVNQVYTLFAPETWEVVYIQPNARVEARYNATTNQMTLFDPQQQRYVVIELSNARVGLYNPITRLSNPTELVILQQQGWIQAYTTAEQTISVPWIAFPTLSVPMAVTIWK